MKSIVMILSFSIAIVTVVAPTVACNNQIHKIILLCTSTTIATTIVAILLFQTERPRIPPSALTSSHTETSKSSSLGSESVATTRVHEVFLSFRGIDTREGFTDFLYTYLIGASVLTFRDDNELRVGEELGPELLKAINESKIYIPILSPNFASSKWCLLELAEMVKCCKNEKHKIYPVFYHVNPSVVKNQTGSYAKAFKKHKKKLDAETVKRWKDALTLVSELEGFELKKQTNGHEGELVKIIVEEVLVELAKKCTKVPENLVGIDNHVENLKGLLEVDSEGVRIVGIHGIRGLGKTTIAKVTYNQICGRFESHCFLNNVQENSEHRDGILHLQSQLLSKIQNRRVSIPDVDEGMQRLKNTFCGRKVLAVFDDVNEISQVNMLIGNTNWFGSGSRIIITTTDSSVLRVLKCSYDTDASYEPKYMEDCDALKLFSRHAFRRDSPLEGYNYLSKEVVLIAAGLPLVLVVLGAYFFEIKGEDVWIDRLKMLRKVPHMEVLKKLRFSFETLENDQKQIFLDIACFFTGWDVTMPRYMWNACGFSVREAINVLIRRSLISVGDDDKLMMHDQLRDLGREIVRTESIVDLGKRSRLWHEVEAPDVLETNKATRRVVALSLPFGRSEGPLLAQSFNLLQNLRYMSMGSYDLDGDFEDLLPSLRWLKWVYSGKFMPTSLPMKNLVTLELSSSRFTKDLEIWNRLKMAKQLKLLDLSKCDGLSFIPYLSTYASLEILKLENFKSLCTLDGLEQLKSLKYLNASRCQHLETLPSLSNLTNLVDLYLDYCEKLVEIQGLEKLEFLEVLGIRACRSLERLPNLSNMKKLRRFNAGGCRKLIKIEGLEKLEFLQFLDISDCRSLERVKVSAWKECIALLSNGCVKLIEIEGLEKLESLENLDLGDCESLERLPDVSKFKMLKTVILKGCLKLIMILGLEKLESLEHLDLGDCRSLRRLPDVSNLRRLKTFIFKGCLNPSEIEGVEKLETLEHLDMGECGSLERVLNLSNMKRLKTFKFGGCMQLIEIDSLKKLEFLQNLHISDCTNLKTIIFSNLDSLENLTICNCAKLSEFEGLNRLRSLNRFNIARCPSLERIPDLPNFGMLKKMEVKFCDSLYEVEELGVISLEDLSILYCDKVTEIRGFQCLKNLKTLSINSLKKLTKITELEELKSLVSLSIIQCNSIEELPDFSNLEKLIEIQVSGCAKLPKISGVEDLKSLKEPKNLLDFPNTAMQRIPTYYADSSDLVVKSEASKSLSSTEKLKNHVPETWLDPSTGNLLLDGEYGTLHAMIELENDLPREWLSDEMDWASTHGETSTSITGMEQGVQKTCIEFTFNRGVSNLSTNKGGPRHRHPRRQRRAKG